MTSTEIVALLSGDTDSDIETLTKLMLSERDRDTKRTIIEMLDKVNDYAHFTECGIALSDVSYEDFILGNCLFEKPSEEFLASFAKINKEANEGNSEAMYLVAMHYIHGSFGMPDFSQAVKWLTKSAEMGNSKAMFELAVCYINGEGVKLDYAKAFEYYEKSAELSNVEAMLALASMYRGAKGIAEDNKKMYYWYCRAADMGNSFAILNKGICTFNGSGVEANIEEAIALVQQAQDMGNGDAKMLLKRMQRYYEEDDLDADEIATRNREKISD